MSTSPGPSRSDDTPVAGARRRSRERALGLLYEAETKGQTPDEVIASLPSSPEHYARELCSGVARRGVDIDALLAAHSNSWALGRMPAIDRQLLRLATFELLERSDVPAAVVIDEAVELAKAYSTEESGRFVNGVLSALVSELRPAEAVARLARS